MHIDGQLVESWKAGDPKAGNRICTFLWKQTERYAVSYSGGDKTKATEAFEEAFLNLQKMVVNGIFKWHDEVGFVSFFKRNLRWRCRDAMRIPPDILREALSLDKYISSSEEGRTFGEIIAEIIPDSNAENSGDSTLIPLTEEPFTVYKFWQELPPALKAVVNERYKILLEVGEIEEDIDEHQLKHRVISNLDINSGVYDQRMKRLRDLWRKWGRPDFINRCKSSALPEVADTD